MKKLLLILAVCFAFIGSAFAAVDINTATQAQLESVKGIGPAKAKAIIDYRTKNGPFKSVDDLDNVKGFGKKMVDKVRSEVSVGGSAAASAKTKSSEKSADKPADTGKADAKAKQSKANDNAAKKAGKTKPAPDTKNDTGTK